MEEIKEVKTVRIDYKCPKCKDGYLRPIGSVLASYPPIYPHQCTDCDYAESFSGKMYPYTDYRNINTP
jgi:hypothetical protein